MGKTDDVDDAELIIAKNRAGRLDDIDMRFIGDQVRFVEDTGSSLLATARALSEAKAQEWEAGKRKREANAGAVPYNPFDGFDKVRPEEFLQK